MITEKKPFDPDIEKECPDCQGTGDEECMECDGSGRVECFECKGEGKVMKSIKEI